MLMGNCVERLIKLVQRLVVARNDLEEGDARGLDELLYLPKILDPRDPAATKSSREHRPTHGDQRRTDASRVAVRSIGHAELRPSQGAALSVIRRRVPDLSCGDRT